MKTLQNCGPRTARSVPGRCLVVTSSVQPPLVNKGWWKPTRARPIPTQTDTFVSPEARNTAFTKSTEQVEPVKTQVRGPLPAWLQGTLLLNGCGDYTGMRHLFDGYASIIRLHIEEGDAVASHRFVQSQAYTAFKSTGRMKFAEFGTSPPSTPQEKLQEVLGVALKATIGVGDAVTDNASVTLIGPVGNGTEVLALTESVPGSYRINATTLETIAQVQYQDNIQGMLQCAHAKQLPDGTIVNFASSFPFGSINFYLQDPATLKRRLIAKIPQRKPFTTALIHEFVITEKYAVVVEAPYFFNAASMLGAHSAEYVVADWEPREGTRVHVVSLDGSGKVKTYSAPAMFSFHQANVFESSNGRCLYLDLSVYDDPAIVNDLLLDRMRTFPGEEISRAAIRRLTIPLTNEQTSAGMYGDLQPELLIPPQPLVDDERVHGNFAEFPCVNPDVLGKEHRYIYGLSAIRPTNFGNALAKWDVKSRACKMWSEKQSYPSGPLFIPRPGGESEDDGVVASLMTGADGSSFVVLLDGRTFEEVSRVELPFKVPNRFHGVWLPKK